MTSACHWCLLGVWQGPHGGEGAHGLRTGNTEERKGQVANSCTAAPFLQEKALLHCQRLRLPDPHLSLQAPPPNSATLQKVLTHELFFKCVYLKGQVTDPPFIGSAPISPSSCRSHRAEARHQELRVGLSHGGGAQAPGLTLTWAVTGCFPRCAGRVSEAEQVKLELAHGTP